MRDTLRDSMSELMQYINNKPNEVTVKKYTFENLPEYDSSALKQIRSKTQMTQNIFLKTNSITS